MCAQHQPGASTWIPERRDVETLRAAAAACRGCDLWRNATRTVFGMGPSPARLMLAGEQPGDHEDRSGIPFSGPAGRLLDRALAAVGIARDDVYVTNVVKHFKWRTNGGRRLHQKPTPAEIHACRPWLDAEIVAVRPELLIALGATAAQALLGPQVRVTRARGSVQLTGSGTAVLVTLHPSALLRIPGEGERQQAIRQFEDDLHQAVLFLRRAA